MSPHDDFSQSSTRATGPRLLAFKDLRIEIDARRVRVGEAEVPLTRSEFELLLLLASNPGVVLSREVLFKELWGTHWVGDGHAVEVQISRLRQKIGDNGRKPPTIATVRSISYRFDGQPSELEVTITYDARLRVTSVAPYDRPFFGWNPSEVIGTYFLLGAGPMAELDQEEAIAIIRSLAAANPRQLQHGFEARRADGTTQQCTAFSEVLTNSDGGFDGWRITLR